MAGDGSGPFVDFVKAYTGQFPELSVEIKRVVAEDDPADVASRAGTSRKHWQPAIAVSRSGR
jgi:hypothetical protein